MTVLSYIHYFSISHHGLPCILYIVAPTFLNLHKISATSDFNNLTLLSSICRHCWDYSYCCKWRELTWCKEWAISWMAKNIPSRFLGKVNSWLSSWMRTHLWNTVPCKNTILGGNISCLLLWVAHLSLWKVSFYASALIVTPCTHYKQHSLLILENYSLYFSYRRRLFEFFGFWDEEWHHCMDVCFDSTAV